MPREIEPSLNEQDFILEALRQNVRVDGRHLDAFRDIQITFGDDFGVVTVEMGKTRCMILFLLYLDKLSHCH